MRTTTLRQQRKRKRPQKLEPPHDTVSAPVTAAAARPAANRKLSHPHRVTPFQYLRIGQSGVRHVNLHRARARSLGNRSAAATNRFVVSKRRVTKHDIVHR